MTLQQILESVKAGSMTVADAERILRQESYDDMEYAKLDISRKERTGFAEVIYCSGKSDEHLLNIFERLYREDGEGQPGAVRAHQKTISTDRVRPDFPHYQN